MHGSSFFGNCEQALRELDGLMRGIRTRKEIREESLEDLTIG
jgi:hypothetical protein